VNREHAKLYFEALYPAVSSAWIAEFRLVAQTKGPVARVWHWAAGCNGLEKALEANERGYHAYLGVNPRRVMGSAKWADIAAVTCLPLDIDHKKTGLSPQIVWDTMKEWEIPPSMVIDSGNGGHLYLLLKEPVTVKAGRRAAQRVCLALESDEIGDPTRVLRVPGSVNWKHPPTWCYLRALDGHRYTLEQINAALDDVGVPVIDLETA